MAVQSDPFRQESGHREADVSSLTIHVREEDPICLDMATRRELVYLMPDIALGWKVFVEGTTRSGADVCESEIFHWLHIANFSLHPDGVATVVEATQLEEKKALFRVEL